MFKVLAPHTSEDLQTVLSTACNRLVSSLNENGGTDWLDEKIDTESGFAAALTKVLVCSEYFLDRCCAQPVAFRELVEAGHFGASRSLQCYRETLQAGIAGCESEDALHIALRLIRQREMQRIIWRDLNRLASLEQTTADISNLATACIDEALAFLYQGAVGRYGTPIGQDSGEPQQLVVLGMGKLGAEELNLSSDVDLIFAFPEAGETDHASKPVSNQEFFLRLGKALIKAIDLRTVDGFVFRCDMRLRPNGESGPLVLNFSAMEDYYQQHGRDWERYAMVKGRAIAGDIAAGEELLEQLRPFVYRRYLDFGSIEALRDMKQLIQQQVARQNLSHDLKLGDGGIREIEFIVQSFQLIHGGRNPDFQQRSLLAMLPVLASNQCLEEEVTKDLDAAYRFLRNSEHALQAWRDEQTQRLPDDFERWQQLAFALGFDTAEAYRDQLEKHRQIVRDIFAGVITPGDSGEEAKTVEHNERQAFWHWVWADAGNRQASLGENVEGLSAMETELVAQLHVFRDSRRVVAMEVTGRERLDAFMPMLLPEIELEDDPLLAFQRILPLVDSVLRRTAYIALLLENPHAMRQLVSLCAASPWIAEQLATYPALLDELLDTGTLYQVPGQDQLADELRQQLLRVNPDDLERTMDVLRHFKLAHGLRVAACQVNGSLSLMKISDYLTWLAEVILQAILDYVWRELTNRYGAPTTIDGDPCDPGFIVVGYGKLGGMEMGPASDLDLVFIHDASSTGETLGEKPVANSVFFNRMGQRMIHILTTQTVSGELYEVDMRLRPSGASGLLVSSFEAFRQYQLDKAWIWEHQALVRARPVAGDSELQQRFQQLRAELIASPRDINELRAEVITMRNKMRQHLDVTGREQDEDGDGSFSLKQSRGGIVDIEFLVQYLVLAHAAEHPGLTRWSDKVRLLETLVDEHIISAEERDQLVEAYTTYRSAAHLAGLRQTSVTAPASEFAELRAQVSAIWTRYLGEN